MHGGVWIASYAVLSVVTLALTFGVLTLFRLSAHRGNAESGAFEWPLSDVYPGSAISFGPDHEISDGLIAVGLADDSGVLPVAASLTAVGANWNVNYRVMLLGARAPGWVGEMGDGLSERVAVVDRLPFEVPAHAVILFLRDGYLMDAAADLVTPSSIMQQFRLAVGPLVSQS
jgi:hypothetical protein